MAKNYTNEDVVACLPSAEVISRSMMVELDHREGMRGYITFSDVQDAVDMVVDKEVNAPLHEACVRYIECSRCITIPASDMAVPVLW